MRPSLLVLLWLTLATAWVQARFAFPDLVEVPIPQLLKRYQVLVKRQPQQAHHHYVLGRLYAMAASAKSQPVNRADREPYFGPLDTGKPADPLPPGAGLDKAIQAYRRAVALEPKNRHYRLGLAWCLEQSGRGLQALKLYRSLLAEVYPEESARQSVGLGPCMTQEVGNSLLRLLDRQANAQEIAEIEAKLAHSQSFGRAVTPVLIPLEPHSDFSQLVNPQAQVAFDLDGSGLQRRWGWITPKAAWLCYSPGKRPIRSGLQLLGGVTFWVFWSHGYQAMAALDQDDDGWLRGEELEHLALWHDSDGRFEPGELKSLASLGIRGLRTDWQLHPQGFPYQPRGVLYANGRTGPSYDWLPRSQP